jgi:hypothetical protein
MVAAACSDNEFVQLFESMGAAGVAKHLRVSPRTVHYRRRSLEGKLGRTLISPLMSGSVPNPIKFGSIPGRLEAEVKNGVVLVGSDAHYWPGEPSTSHKAFVKFCKEMKPAIVVMNGDVLDGASISRHAPIGWESRPTLKEEIETCQDRLGEITTAAGKALRFWPLGNHDARLESKIAAMVPEFAKVKGVHLRDHFVDWEACWSLFINHDVVVKHRFKGGIHAPWNNTMNAGRTIVTGHLHSQKVYPLTDYNGTRWGVDAGCMASTFGRQFTGYTEDNARNWREGFAVLSFVDGVLLQPELVRVIDEGRIDFRGKIIEV